jgi:hypothetical protein
MQGTKKHTGGCHCGAVRFEVELDLAAGGTMCNCTVCTKIASVGAIVKASTVDAITAKLRRSDLASHRPAKSRTASARARPGGRQPVERQRLVGA